MQIMQSVEYKNKIIWNERHSLYFAIYSVFVFMLWMCEEIRKELGTEEINGTQVN